MLWKGIEMDLPYIREAAPEDLSSDGLKLDYARNWKEKRRQFQLMTRCMTSMVERIAPRITTGDFWKILIECVEKEPKDECINVTGVYCVQVAFDINGFFAWDDLQKKHYATEKIREAANRLAQYASVDLSGIHKACDGIAEARYVNEWLWRRPVKNKAWQVQVRISHGVERAGIYMLFSNPKQGLQQRVLLTETAPDERAYARCLGKLEWISDDTAKLSTKDGGAFTAAFCPTAPPEERPAGIPASSDGSCAPPPR